MAILGAIPAGVNPVAVMEERSRQLKSDRARIVKDRSPATPSPILAVGGCAFVCAPRPSTGRVRRARASRVAEDIKLEKRKVQRLKGKLGCLSDATLVDELARRARAR